MASKHGYIVVLLPAASNIWFRLKVTKHSQNTVYRIKLGWCVGIMFFGCHASYNVCVNLIIWTLQAYIQWINQQLETQHKTWQDVLASLEGGTGIIEALAVSLL